jgi:hypothetical protein
MTPAERRARLREIARQLPPDTRAALGLPAHLDDEAQPEQVPA